jgi:hypothetical protein
MFIRVIRWHYRAIIASLALIFSVFLFELIRSRLDKNSFDLGYVEYVAPLLLLLLCGAFFFSLFKWNKKLARKEPSDLFWMIILLGTILISLGIFHKIENWDDVFPYPKAPNPMGYFFEGLFGTKPEPVKKMDKILFWLYTSASLSVMVSMFLTVMVKRQKTAAAT